MDGSSVIFIVMPIVIPLVIFAGHRPAVSRRESFQPLLHQVSTGYLVPEEVGAALHAIEHWIQGGA